MLLSPIILDIMPIMFMRVTGIVNLANAVKLAKKTRQPVYLVATNNGFGYTSELKEGDKPIWKLNTKGDNDARTK